MLREALASGHGKGDEIDSDSGEEDSDAIESLQRPDEDEPDDDFFMDSAMRELRESECHGQDSGAVDGSGEDGGGAVVAERDVSRAREEPVSRTNDGRGRFFGFGGKSDSTSSSSTSSSSSDTDSGGDRGDRDSDEDHDLMTAFANATMAAVEEGGDTSDSTSSTSSIYEDKGGNNVEDSSLRPIDPVTAVQSSSLSSKRRAGLSEKDRDDNLGSAVDDGGGGSSSEDDKNGTVVLERNESDIRGESLESAGKRGRRKAGVSKQGDVRPGTVGVGGKSYPAAKGARRRRRQAVKAAKEGRAKGDEDDGLGCRVCGRRFPSRSKLFAHVKAEGHAVLA